MYVDSFCVQAFEVTLIFFYPSYIAEHGEEDVALKVACTTGIHLRLCFCPHIHVHMCTVLIMHQLSTRGTVRFMLGDGDNGPPSPGYSASAEIQG